MTDTPTPPAVAPISDDDLRKLLDAATPGRRVQFHPFYCPEAVGTPFTDYDSSHEMSVILPSGTRYKIATYKHADDAALSQIAPQLAAEVLARRADLAAPSAPAEADPPDVRCNSCGWLGYDDDLVASIDTEDGEPSHPCPNCGTDANLLDIDAPAEVEGLVPPELFSVCQRCIDNREFEIAGNRLEDLRWDGEKWACEECWDPDESDKWGKAPQAATALTTLSAEKAELKAEVERLHDARRTGHAAPPYQCRGCCRAKWGRGTMRAWHRNISREREQQ